MRHKRFVGVLVGLILALALSAIIGMGVGAVMKPPGEVITAFVTGEPLIWKCRAPRILVGICAGIAMAVSGCLLQSALRNPLAAPDTVGITSGGGLAAVAVLMGSGALPAHLLTFIAFIGALAGTGLVLLLAGRGASDPVRLPLTGVAVSFGLGAITELLLVRAAPEAGAAMTWLKGSLYARSLGDATIVAPFILLALTVAMVVAKHLDMLALDDSTMAGIGVSAKIWRLIAIALAVILGAAGVAAAGVLGFAGLIVPHAARLIVGANLRWQIPVAALGGAVLVTACDTLGRWAFAPTEIPVGALIALIGAPYFIFLLTRLTRVRNGG